MPFGQTHLLGLVVAGLGVVGLICAFSLTDRRRYLISLVLSLLLIGLGGFHYVRQSLKQMALQRRIDGLQDRQRVNLEAIRDRLKSQTEGGNAAQNQAKPPAKPAGR